MSSTFFKPLADSNPSEKKRILPTELRNQRAILHIDLDCFYCQVEQLRLGIPNEKPVAVLQWNGLIAINYAARAFGVKRLCTPEEAKKLCPDIQFVHVATYANGDTEFKYHPNPSPHTHKVSLDPYRRASRQIFSVLERFCSRLQRGSIDEGFLDVTDKVNQTILDRYFQSRTGDEESLDEVEIPPVRWDGLGVLVGVDEDEGEGEEIKGEWAEVQLMIAAEYAIEIRTAVFDELGYTCSAGIAQNKTLAKLCSGLNKPNNQTIMRPRAVLPFMRNLPFQKIRNLGGKLGKEVEAELEVVTAGDLWQYSEEELQAKFGSGLWLYNISRGIDFSEVTPVKENNKSMMCAKSFPKPIRTDNEVKHWIGVLSSELYSRVTSNFEANSHWPKTLVLNYRQRGAYKSKSKSCPFIHRKELKSPDTLSQKLLELFFGSLEHQTPITGISIAALGIQKDESATSKDITTFFQSSATLRGNVKISNEAILNEKREVTHSSSDESRFYKSEKPVEKKELKGLLRFFQKTPGNAKENAGVKGGMEPRDDEGEKVNMESAKSADGEERSNEWIRCEECNSKIESARWVEHQDYHLAIRLQRESHTPSSSTVVAADPLQSERRKADSLKVEKTLYESPSKRPKVKPFFLESHK
ncbi:uncharacterized protein VTP21DRAFT_767 [Calcarisporiella thermophila]|uniref:uncharacterized protein n=1 Tax=Calcarisporiella thermophila TaxID=911321 RepID=UPI003742A009